jgi:hypothetical protein
VVLRPRQMEGAAAKLQEEDEAHLVGEFWFMSTWVREWSRTKWRCAPGRQRGQQPSSRRRRMGPTLVRELRLVSSRTVSRAGLEEDGAHSSYSYNGLWGVTDSPSTHSSSLLARPGKGMEGGEGRRVVEAYHHQLQVSGVVKSLHAVFRCGVCGHEGHDTASCLRVSKPVV